MKRTPRMVVKANARTCDIPDLFAFCEEMRWLKAKDAVLQPGELHKLGFWLGEKLPEWVCKKNDRLQDYNALVAEYERNGVPLGFDRDDTIKLHELMTGMLAAALDRAQTQMLEVLDELKPAPATQVPSLTHESTMETP